MIRTVRLRGMDLLNNPALNKGTAFSEDERKSFGLHGLLPPVVESLDDQCIRAYQAFSLKSNDLERHIYLRQLQDTNEVLFYRLLLDHIDEMLPIVYTPVVALGCQEFSHIYRRPRGLFISYPLRNFIPALLRNHPNPEVDVIVVTDGERILGIGDQGVGGLGIPIGKLSLYSLIGGIHPARTLPVVLDVGTNNEERLRDPEYLGWRHARITGPEYDSFIDAFVAAVKQILPSTLLQWEDFSGIHARPILNRYRGQMLTFNDDIQGTAAVTLGAILSALRVANSSLRDQEIVFLGAGSASTGVADYLRAALVNEGLSEEEARSRFWMVDRLGLLHSGRTDLTPEQRIYGQPLSRVSSWPRTGSASFGLADVIHHVRATILIGLSTMGSAFTEGIVREMAGKLERPIIFPLSNPTQNSEADPADLFRWTNGRALIATGSPFPPVQFEGRSVPISQCNNVYIFPAVGLAVVAARPPAQRITDAMMIAAAQKLAEHSPALRDPSAPLLPALKDLRSLAREIALAVAQEAARSSLAPALDSSSSLRSEILASQWSPAYPAYIPSSP
ncbi:MAG TPA: NAD-dependent malic enzyme [Verrucomicrobiae bacterium]|jgi:malate dehydrogenase (oxaloacetate-decarboxylating)|nr:NAD-dependent malic enzyme [Verrucomicrobiae bacterium]